MRQRFWGIRLGPLLVLAAILVGGGGPGWPVQLPALAAPTELFFSEYVEGSGNSKALEIFNGTETAVDLAAGGYDVQFFFNGSATPGATIALSGVIPAGQVFVLADDGAAAEILARANQLYTGSFFNGDDAIALRRAGVNIDVIGQIGLDPGSEWGSGQTSTQDNTLRRRPGIDAGDPDGSDPFDPALAWEGYPPDTFDGLGAHSLLPPLPSVTPTDTPTPEFTPTATVTPEFTPTAPPLPTDTATPTVPPPVPPGAVVINEMAWGGSAASTADEWLELFNTTAAAISLDGWQVTSTNGLRLSLAGAVIGPNDYLLIERTDDTTVSDIPGDVVASFGSGLSNSGDSLFLLAGSVVIDTANADGGPWPAGSGSPTYTSMERVDPFQPDTDANWTANDGRHRNGLAADGSPLNGTPRQANSAAFPAPTPEPSPTPTPAVPLTIGEVLYDGQAAGSEGDEFVEICNPNAGPVNLAGYKVGDEETAGGGESMLLLPSLELPPGGCVVFAKSAVDFTARFGFAPAAELSSLPKYTAWSSGGWSLANTGDEVLLLGPADQIFDSVAFRGGEYGLLGLSGDAAAPEPLSLQRVGFTDTNSMPFDFVRAAPNPGQPTLPPAPPNPAPLPAALPGGMNAYWGHLHAHTTVSDGAGPPHYALALARAAGLHFYAITDHGWRTELAEWTAVLSQTQAATVPGQFVALRGVEWTLDDAGHINVFNSDTLLSRTNPLFANLTSMYNWLAAHPQVAAQFNHPDPGYGGTFNNFALHSGAASQLFLQEIGNAAQEYSFYETSFLQSNYAGWRIAPTINGDTHSATWGSDLPGRTGIIAPALTEADLLDALAARRVFATEDSNLALALHSDGVWQGSQLAAAGPISLTVYAIDPDAEPLTLHLYDRNLRLASASFGAGSVEWPVSAPARPGHFYWVKAVQADGDRAYTAPLWLDGAALPDLVQISEVLPSPIDVDWNGDGQADFTDEWIELQNPMSQPVGLGGWRLADSSGAAFDIPLGIDLPPGGYVTLYTNQLGFSLNNSGDSLTLFDPTGAVIDQFSYGHSPGYDESWCRLPVDRWSDNCGPSPNADNWELPANGPLRASIFEAKRFAYGAWVQVKGRVTAPPGLLGGRTMYIQDDSAGIMVYLPKDHRLHFNLGDKVRVLGDLRQFHGEAEIVVDEPGDVDFMGPGLPPPPLPIATTSLLEPYEGRLVQLSGQAVRFKGRTTLWVDDGTDPAQVYFRPGTGIRKPYMAAGTPLTVVGVVSQYSDPDAPTRNDYRLLPRFQSDLLVQLPAPVATATAAPAVAAPANWPSCLPDTGY
ncbi:MAG: hypothetical protein FOGNACKC_01541 [Anaerolineae bacterium]|nr:hypothetical protein [Anaerolineae bacterium]